MYITGILYCYVHVCIVLFAIEKMEDKMKWAKNYERVQEIARQLSWPPVTDLDPRVFIPEASLFEKNNKIQMFKTFLLLIV